MSHLVHAEVYRLKPGYIQITNELIVGNYRKAIKESSLQNLELKGKVNNIKHSTQKKIETMLLGWMKSINYFNYYLASANVKLPHKPLFLTLTLCASQSHSDEIIKNEMLIPFISTIKRIYEVKYYFWKAEKQKNGNIHFHLIIDKYINKFEVQELWNKYLAKFGYIDKFESKFGHKTPPSTRIELITKLDKVTAYIVKYICKNNENQQVSGLKWGCSDNLKHITEYNEVVDSEISLNIIRLEKEGKLRRVSKEYVTYFYFTKLFDYQRDYKCFENREAGFYLTQYKMLYLMV